MSRKLKAGIIGCGGIANGKHMPSINKVKEVEMVAFCDLVEERAIKASKDYGTESATYYTDYKTMLAECNLDVIYVCTPNKSHSYITIDALEAGCHVMCEKPMAKTSEEGVAMVEAAKKTGKKLTIGYQNRFRPDSTHLKKMCERGDLGDIYFAKAHAIRRRAVPTWGVFLNEEEQGGGPLIDIGTHALDLTLWCMENYRPVRVVGKAYKKLGDQRDTGNAWGDWKQGEFTVEDSAFGYVTMENGATIIIESSWALNTLDTGEAQTTLCGTKAGADMKDSLRINGADLGKLYVTKPGLSAEGVDFYDGDSANAGDLEAQSFIDCIIQDKDPVVKPEEALVVTQILEAIYKSSELGKEITLA